MSNSGYNGMKGSTDILEQQATKRGKKAKRFWAKNSIALENDPMPK